MPSAKEEHVAAEQDSSRAPIETSAADSDGNHVVRGEWILG